MFDHLFDWIKTVLGDKYKYSRGMWVDHASLSDEFICALHQAGGMAPDVDDRRPRYRLILLGPRNGRQHVVEVQTDMDSLAQAALGDSAPCGAASVRAVGEAVGPGYTTENRAWFSLDLEVLY